MKILNATLIACALATIGTATAEARDLTVVSWGGNYQDAQRKIYFEPFAKQTGKPVLDESWDGGYGVLQAKVKAGIPNWDAVQVEAEELALGCADGIYEKVDWDKLGWQVQVLAGCRQRLRRRRDRLVNRNFLRWRQAQTSTRPLGPTFGTRRRFPASAACAKERNTRLNSP